MSKTSFVGLLSFGLLIGSPALATCGSATCFLVSSTSDGVAPVDTLTVDFSVRIVDQDRKRSGTRSVAEVLTPKIDFENGVILPDHHREISTVSTFVQADLAYGLTARLSLLASIPVWVDKEHEHWDEVGEPEEHFTNADGTEGFGDIQVGARYAFVVRSRDMLVGSVSIELPTGPYRLLDSEGSVNEPTIQPGSGSYDLLASAGYSRRFGEHEAEWFVTGAGRWNGENDLDYQLGREGIANVGARFPVREKIELSIQLNGRWATRDRWLGGPVPSTGSTTVYATPGIRFRSSDQASFYFHVQLPVYESVNEAQLAPRTGYVLGVSRSF